LSHASSSSSSSSNPNLASSSNYNLSNPRTQPNPLSTFSPTAALVAYGDSSLSMNENPTSGFSPLSPSPRVSPTKAGKKRVPLGAVPEGSVRLDLNKAEYSEGSSGRVLGDISNEYPFNQPLDTPMKNQMMYHLGRHIARGGGGGVDETGVYVGGQHTPVHPMAKR
jgi:hypothetical protein